ncbi:MAG TPA: oxygenase MpaB family protein [Myxococcota bacterium]|nr:oxygenase MpaB family protein [Myxococcota bacterium]
MTPSLAPPPSRSGPLGRLRRSLVQEIEAAGGRHDEASLYEGEPGDPGLAGGPGSVSWELHGDLASLVVGGTGAILMEVLHPSVMAGVYTQSSYRTEPLRRARNTLGYVLRTTFGSTPAATGVIESVKRVHSRIEGTRPDGVPYRALDPELIAWVHTCIPWAVMGAYERYKRPLRREEKDRYLAEQAVIGRMGGADWVPESVSELEDYVERMRPKMGFHEQTREFLAFLAGASGDFEVGRRERLDRWVAIRASMSLMPEWARRLTGTYQPELVRRLWLEPSDRLKASLIRWAYPELPCKRMALERATGATKASRAPGEPRSLRLRTAT